MCDEAVLSAFDRGASLFYTLQNATEFWNVSTRPADKNGHGRTGEQALEGLRSFEQLMELLPDDFRVYDEWKRLVQIYSVRGVQVHDARLAASMVVHGVHQILTLNGADFARYPGIEAIHPALLTS